MDYAGFEETAFQQKGWKVLRNAGFTPESLKEVGLRRPGYTGS